MGTLKKYWPSILSILGGLTVAFTPWVRQLAIHNPEYASLIAAAWGVICHHLQSPNDVPKT